MTTANTTAIAIEALDCGTEIKAEAIKAGVVPTLVGDNGRTGDDRISLWQVGDTQAVDTNGGAHWQEATARDEWDALVTSLDN